MSTITDYFKNYVLDAVLGDGKAAGIPATMYFGLLSTEPSASGSGTEVSSIGTGYARVAVPNDNTRWSNAAGSLKRNAAPIQFPTATSTWGNLGWYGIWDAPSGGNLLIWGALLTPVTVNAGDSPYFNINQLAITA